MSKCNRSYIAAALGLSIAIGGSAVGVYYLDNPITNQATTEEHNPRSRIILDLDERAVRALESIADAENSNEDKERARRDLDAQEGMWRWTKWVVWVAIVQLVLSGLGIAFVVQSLRQGQLGLSAARRALRHARVANDIASRNAHAELRPYVYLSRKELTYGGPIPGMIDNVGEVIFELKNYGQTPAKNVIFWAAAEIGGYWSDSPAEPNFKPIEIRIGDLAPQATIERDGYHVIGLAENQMFLENGTTSVFAFGKIAYSDAAGNTFETNFRLASTEENFKAKKFAICPEGNEAT